MLTDIIENGTETRVTFTAKTVKAESWMRDRFGTTTVTYRVLSVKKTVMDFRKAARVARLTIREHPMGDS